MLPRRPTSDEAAAGNRLTLAEAERYSRVRVTRVTGRPRLIQRLAALGVVPGVMLTVLRPHGPAMVSMGGARIAIGKSAAQSVEIEVAE
ncbi:MAG: FeoA family protein [Acidimicrobiia bacterium]|nr:FeoA family protein [Acidimicrobiia bacterium]